VCSKDRIDQDLGEAACMKSAILESNQGVMAKVILRNNTKISGVILYDACNLIDDKAFDDINMHFVVSNQDCMLQLKL